MRCSGEMGSWLVPCWFTDEAGRVVASTAGSGEMMSVSQPSQLSGDQGGLQYLRLEALSMVFH